MPLSWSNEVLAPSGVLLSTIERIDADGAPWVRVPDGRRIAAQWVAGISAETLKAAADSQTPVVIAFAGEDSAPIILGMLATNTEPAPPASARIEAEIDGRRVALNGQEEITLRCGRASITLTKAGKILIRGTYLSSRSSGVNRIKGGSVQIN